MAILGSSSSSLSVSATIATIGVFPGLLALYWLILCPPLQLVFPKLSINDLNATTSNRRSVYVPGELFFIGALLAAVIESLAFVDDSIPV
jgi:hypothetical protein